MKESRWAGLALLLTLAGACFSCRTAEVVLKVEAVKPVIPPQEANRPAGGCTLELSEFGPQDLHGKPLLDKNAVVLSGLGPAARQSVRHALDSGGLCTQAQEGQAPDFLLSGQVKVKQGTRYHPGTTVFAVVGAALALGGLIAGTWGVGHDTTAATAAGFATMGTGMVLMNLSWLFKPTHKTELTIRSSLARSGAEASAWPLEAQGASTKKGYGSGLCKEMVEESLEQAAGSLASQVCSKISTK
jgi:hypothetical protein